MTESFIFRESTKVSSLEATYHIGSIPNGYTQSDIAVASSSASAASQHEPKRFRGIDMKSLYTNPQNIAKNPIKSSRYLIVTKTEKVGCDLRDSALMQMYDANKNKRVPWPMSPNISPKKNGKVTMLKRVGFASLYVGTP